MLPFQLINPDAVFFPSWSRLRGSLVESFLSKHLAGRRREPSSRKVGRLFGFEHQHRAANLPSDEEEIAGESREGRRP